MPNDNFRTNDRKPDVLNDEDAQSYLVFCSKQNSISFPQRDVLMCLYARRQAIAMETIAAGIQTLIQMAKTGAGKP
jgi:hypothetical protein